VDLDGQIGLRCRSGRPLPAQVCAGVARQSGYPGLCSARHLAILWQNQHDRQMIRSFSILPLVLLLFADQGTGVRGQETAGGQQLLAEAVRRVDQETAIAADLRYRVDAFGRQLLGTGTYLQCGAGPQRRLRVDLRMQVGERPATLQEIRGPDYYWIRKEVPPAAATLGRVDLVQLSRALRPTDEPTGLEVTPRQNWILLGGLPRLLAALERSFEFSEAKQDEVQITTGGQQQRLPIWVLEGRWKPARLAALTGRAPGMGGRLPEQLPDRAQVVLDRSDQSLRLFPYRISYWRAAQVAPGASRGSEQDQELLALELFNVRRIGAVNPREFQYSAGEQEVLDLTTAYIQQLGGERKLR
jgi:hypothetical protein